MLLACAAFIAGSWYYSQPVYRFYLTAYYRGIRGYDAALVQEKAEKLLKDKKYGECDRFLRTMLAVFINDHSVIKTVGNAYIKMGKRQEGASLLVSALDGSDMGPDELVQVLPELVKQGYFGEITALLRDRQDLPPGTRRTYGIALYHRGEFREAAKQLELSVNETDRDDSSGYFFLALALEKTGQTSRAVYCMEKAYSMNPSDRKIREELAAMYRKARLYERAAALIKAR